MSTEAALLAAIAADPDDDTARLVFADFLEEKGGEPDAARARFIRAQVELARPAQRGESAHRRELLSEVKQLHKRYGPEWAKPVLDAAGTSRNKFSREPGLDTWDRGFLGWVQFKNVAEFRKRAPAVSALGPLTGLTFRLFKDSDVRRLAEMPALRTVRRLSLFGSGWGEDANTIGDAPARVLAESPYLGRLEELDLTQNRLTTEGVRAIAFSPRLTRLQKLNLYGNELNDDTYAMLVGSPLAARMTEWDVNGTPDVTSGAARIIARATSFTHLTALSFDNTGITDSGLEALTAAKHLSGLRSLNLRNTNITHLGVRAITRSPVFANLRELNFVKTWINGFGARFLRESPYLKKIKMIALYDAVPRASEKKLAEKFGRKAVFHRI
jgi:uncharacterized protein (TIGR02996 family)